jgi:hypothetical protein
MRANGEIKDAFYFENNTPEDTFRDKETGQQQERSSLPVSQQRGIVPSNASSMQRDAKVVVDLAAAVAQAAATGETEAQQLSSSRWRVSAFSRSTPPRGTTSTSTARGSTPRPARLCNPPPLRRHGEGPLEAGLRRA